MMSPTQTKNTPILELAQAVFKSETQAIHAVENKLDAAFEKAILLLEHCQGRIVLTGMGKSGHIAKKIAATFSSLGSSAYFLHPAEGVHGDLGLLNPNDVVIALSKSGETAEILQIIPVIKHLKIPVIALVGNVNSTLAEKAEVALDLSVEEEACALNLAPTNSTTVSLVMGDALAIVLSQRKGFNQTDFALFHPAGSLGKRLLLKVEDVMHKGDELPLVDENTPVTEALFVMSAKKLGMTVVLNAQKQSIGILTDGDLRRALTKHESLQSLTAKQVMTLSPKTIEPETLAANALSLMEQFNITTLLVNNADNKPIGVVHLHDLLKSGL